MFKLTVYIIASLSLLCLAGLAAVLAVAPGLPGAVLVYSVEDWTCRPSAALMMADVGFIQWRRLGAPWVLLRESVGCHARSESPSCSQDGARIAFHSNVVPGTNRYSGVFRIYLMEMAGLTSRVVDSSFDTLSSFNPALSPDGSRVALMSRPHIQQPRNIYITDLLRVTWTMLVVDGNNPVWSADGTQVMYTAFDAGGYSLDVINADGSGRRQLARNAWPVAWSPDGAQIALRRYDNRSGQVYLMPADGSGEPALFSPPGMDVNALDWSPDGSRLAFIARQNGQTDLFIMRLADGHIERVTNDPFVETGLCWLR